MIEPQQAALARLSEDFTAMSRQMARVATQLDELQLTLGARPAVPPPAPVLAPPAAPAPVGYAPRYAYPPAVYPPAPYPGSAGPITPPPPTRPAVSEWVRSAHERGWIGKLLAVAGVAVTLVGVVLLLILAAQAGILRPEIRVGAGAVLAGGLVTVAARFNRRPGGRIGAIALAATGIAAAYLDIIAIAIVYDWVAPPVGLIIASTVGGTGLMLARRWDSEHLGLLVLVPLIILAPIVTDGITLLLIGFMLALSAAALPVQLGKDWGWMHAARTVAVSAPLCLALLVSAFGSADDPWLLGGACAVAALLAVVGALILLPASTHRVAVALLTVAGVLPALTAAIAVDRLLAALLAAAVSVGVLAVVLAAGRVPGVDRGVRTIFSALSAVSALVAVTVACNGHVEGPVLLALAVVVSVAGRRDTVARWAATGFAVVGAGVLLGYAPPVSLVQPTPLPTAVAVSTLAASILLVAASISIAWSWTRVAQRHDGRTPVMWAAVVAVTAYAVSTFTVTAGVLIGGRGGGFLAGHTAGTICWIAIAAALFVFAVRVAHRDARTAPIAGGLALTAAATAKLFLFDLGTLDGMFRVAAFIVVGLVLLGMGAGYARSLGRPDGSPPT